MPTAYLISYSRELIRSNNARARRALDDCMPSGVPVLATLHCYEWVPPPFEVCEVYSGVSRGVQEYVMRDARARQGMWVMVFFLFHFFSFFGVSLVVVVVVIL